MEIEFLKKMEMMKRFIVVMSICTFSFIVIFCILGGILGSYVSFGFLEYLLGQFFIGEILMIFSPLFSFIIYLLYFDYPEEMVSISKFKNHVPVVHYLDDENAKNIEV